MATSTYCLVTALALAGLVLGALVVTSRRRAQDGESGTVDASVVLRVTWVALLAGIVQVVVGVVVLGFDYWDLMSVIYLDVTVALPVVGVGVLALAAGGRWGSGARVSRPVVALATVALLPAAVGWYATHVEPNRLVTRRATVDVASERAGDDEVTIGVLSDLQPVRVTEHERAAVRRVVEANPDVILIAGDVFQGTAHQLAASRDDLRELFASMDVPGGAYVVPGDADEVSELEELTRGTPVRVLADETTSIRVGDRHVTLAGVSLLPSPAGRAVVQDLEERSGTDDVRILLGHRPDWVLGLSADSRVDLVVAGHTHGGQVQLPVIGPVLTLTEVPRRVAAGGLHEVDGNAVYVSSGVGRQQRGAPQVRFLDPPSVAILTLRG